MESRTSGFRHRGPLPSGNICKLITQRPFLVAEDGFLGVASRGRSGGTVVQSGAAAEVRLGQETCLRFTVVNHSLWPLKNIQLLKLHLKTTHAHYIHC